MKINHSIEKFAQSITKDSKASSFLITNKKEGFAWINPKEVSSRYQGIFFSEDEKIFRVIESINPYQELKQIKDKYYEVEVEKEGKKEIFFMPDNLNGFVFETNSPCGIFLDFKEAYEDSYANYEIEKIQSGAVIKIIYKEKEYYLAICFEGKFLESKKWFERTYEYDKKRNSYPLKRSVFFAGETNSKKNIFYFSSDKKEAIEKAKELYEHVDYYKGQKKKRIEDAFKKISDEKVNMAYNSCRILLDNLTNKEGLFAGLPWFFQYWARDELISLKALSLINKKDSEKILKKWFAYLSEDFTRFPAKLKINGLAEGNSLDSIGWLLKRTELFPEILQENKEKINSLFLNLDSEIIIEQENTWMDSIKRKGGIEIQAMKLFSLNLAYKLSGKEEFSKKEEELKNKVRENYWNGKILFDSLDKKIRPNAFIAYYFYPTLLEKKEWETCFDEIITHLWCEWGGFSTISKQDQQFHKEYSGENGESYHNGDSWFWINNLSGLVLTRINKERYYEYIKKILNASTEEILFCETIANHSELSSACSLKSQGASCQSFSAAMYLEFIEEIKKI
jgi:glycogen debranching enzyme